MRDVIAKSFEGGCLSKLFFVGQRSRDDDEVVKMIDNFWGMTDISPEVIDKTREMTDNFPQTEGNSPKSENVKLYKKKSESKGEIMWLISMYVINMLGYMLVALPIYMIVRIIFVKMRKQPVKKSHEVLLALFVLYLVGLASQTIIPRWNMGVDGLTGEFYFDVYLYNNLTTVNVIPFRTIMNYFHANDYVSNWDSVSLVNLLGNVFVFSPIGIFIPMLWKRMSSIVKITFIGLGVTCFIEAFQYFIGRSTDIDDIILNTIGVVIGYGVFLVWKVFVTNEKTVDLN